MQKKVHIRLSLACSVQIYTASTHLDHTPILSNKMESPLDVSLKSDTIARVRIVRLIQKCCGGICIVIHLQWFCIAI